MKLKKNVDLPAFLRQVQQCQGEVWFVTDGGDQLNLKSMLSEYLFLSAAISSTLAEHGRVELQNPADREILIEYLEEV